MHVRVLVENGSGIPVYHVGNPPQVYHITVNHKHFSNVYVVKILCVLYKSPIDTEPLSFTLRAVNISKVKKITHETIIAIVVEFFKNKYSPLTD